MTEHHLTHLIVNDPEGDEEAEREQPLTDLEYLVGLHWQSIFMRTPPRGWRYGVRALRFRGATIEHWLKAVEVSATRVNLKSNDHRWNYACGVIKGDLDIQRRDSEYYEGRR